MAYVNTDCLKTHWLIFILAFFLTLIIKLPLFVFPVMAGSDYRGINIYHFGNLAVDEDFYMARGKDVLEGHLLGNPLFREGKNTKIDYYFNISEYVLVGPFYLLGLGDKIDISKLYNFYNFLGVFLLIILIYFFLLELNGDKFFAAFVSIFIISGYSIIDHRGFFDPVFNMYGRSLYPYLSSLAFFGYLFLCARALKNSSLKKSIFAGIIFGALFYIYLYAWTFVFIVNAFLFLIFLFKKDWESLGRIFLISSLGILIGAYNILRTFIYATSPAGEQSAYFYHLVLRHALTYGKLGPALLILFGVFVYFWQKKENKSWQFVYALLFASWFSLNQQIITGRQLESDHYLWYYALPIFIIAISYVLWSFIKSKKIALAILISGVLMFFTNTAIEQYGALEKTLGARIYEQNYKGILDILNSDKTPGVVLAADDDHETLITIYTPHDLFWQRINGQYNDNPVKRQRDALLVYLFLNKESRKDPAAYLKKILNDENNLSFYKTLYQNVEGYTSGFSFYDYFNRLSENDGTILRYREIFIKNLAKDYKSLAGNTNGFEKMLDGYGVDWILWDKNRQGEWDLSALKNLREAGENHGIFIFKREIGHNPQN